MQVELWIRVGTRGTLRYERKDLNPFTTIPTILWHTNAHNTIIMKPGTTTDSNDASKKGRIRKLVLITLYIIWLTILWLPNLRQCLFRQRPLLPQHTVKKSTNPRSRPPIMPYLPLEIRLCIYSYLLPDRNPVSTSRALRATCKQLDDEVRYEARTAFVRTMISMQRACFDSTVTFFCASRFHVEVVVILPVDFQHITSPQPRPLAASPFERSLLTVLQGLPTNTRSFTLTLQPHPDASTRTFREQFFETWTLMEGYFAQNANNIRAGHTDLSAIKVRAGAPITLSPMIWYERHMWSWTLRLAWTFTWSRLEALQFKQGRDEDKVSISGLGNFDTRRRWATFVLMNTLVKWGWRRVGLDFRMG